jgi:DNA-binding NarL/FixJ family response regulator
MQSNSVDPVNPWEYSSILLIEDNPGDAALFAHYLSLHGAQSIYVETVATLAEALAAIQSKPFEAIVLDLNLPDAKGTEAITELRDHQPDIPIIILSGILETGMTSYAVQRGVDSFHNKESVSSDSLVYSIRMAIDRKRTLSSSAEMGIDEFTGLFNQYGLQCVASDAIQSACSDENDFCLLWVRITSLRNAAEARLCDLEAARIIERTFRSTDIIARLGPAEYAICITGSGPINEAALRNRLALRLRGILAIDTNAKVEIGSSLYRPDESTLSTLIIESRSRAIEVAME